MLAIYMHIVSPYNITINITWNYEDLYNLKINFANNY